MELFVEQQLELFEDSNDPNIDGKPLREISRPDIVIIEGRYFFVSGSENVYLLNQNDLSYKLSVEEIQELPVEIVYTGEQRPDYQSNEKNMFELILKMISKVNIMQTSRIYSFPLG